MRHRILCAAVVIVVVSSHGLGSPQIDGPASSGGRRRAIRFPPPCAASFAVTESDVAGILVDETSVYYACRDSVKRVAKNGGPASFIVNVHDATIMFVTGDAANVYFLARDRTSNTDSVYAVPKSGGSATLLVRNVFAYKMIPDGDSLYLAYPGTVASGSTWNADGRILRVRKDGSGVDTLASSLRGSTGLFIDGNDLYFSERGTSDADQSGGLRRMSKDGGPVTTLASIPGAMMLAGDASNVYVLQLIGSDLGAIHVVSKATGSSTPLVPSVSFDVYEPIAVFGESLYFMNLASGTRATVDAVLLSTGERRTIAEFEGGFPDFAIDSCGVYYDTAAGIERAGR